MVHDSARYEESGKPHQAMLRYCFMFRSSRYLPSAAHDPNMTGPKRDVQDGAASHTARGACSRLLLDEWAVGMEDGDAAVEFFKKVKLALEQLLGRVWEAHQQLVLRHCRSTPPMVGDAKQRLQR